MTAADNNKKPTNWCGKQNATPLTFDPVGRDIFGRFFSNFDIYRPEVAGDVITGVALKQVGMDVRGKFCDSMLNSSRNYSTLSPAGPVLHTFMRYLDAFYSRPEAANDVISGSFVGPVVPDNRVKLDGHHTNGSREIPPKVVGGVIFDDIFAITSDRK